MKCSAGSYLTDLEIKPTPTLLALELINGCEQVAQRTSWLEVKKTPHLEPATHHQYFQYITKNTQNQCSYRNIFLPSSSPTAGSNGHTCDSQAEVELVSLIISQVFCWTTKISCLWFGFTCAFCLCIHYGFFYLRHTRTNRFHDFLTARSWQ